MKNKKIILVHDRMYEVDTSFGTMNLSYLLGFAASLGNEELLKRSVIAVMVLSIGIDEFLRIPIEHYELTAKTVLDALLGESKINASKTN